MAGCSRRSAVARLFWSSLAGSRSAVAFSRRLADLRAAETGDTPFAIGGVIVADLEGMAALDLCG